MSKNSYGQESITRLRGEDRVRQRPSVIFGTNDEYGAAHGIYEIIANSIDEAREGHGNRIEVSIFKNGEVQVKDYGRGIPLGWNESEQEYNWQLVFCTLYASGKYKDDNYGESLGLNGLGATATQYASEFMDVYSVSNGEKSYMRFEKGRPVGELKVVKAEGEETGTTIRFKPDSEVFIGLKNNVLPADYYINKLRRQAMLHAGLEVVLYHEEVGREIVLRYDEGIKEFVSAICTKPMLKETFEISGAEWGVDDPDKNPEKYKLNMRVAFNFSRHSELVELYHNGSHLYEGGVTMDALRMAFHKSFEDHAKEIGKLNKSDKLHYRDIESILVCVGDTNAPGNRTFFKHQTKSAINNPFIKKAYADFLYYHIRNWLKEDSNSEKVLAEVLINKLVREEADRVSKKAVQSLTKKITFGNKPKKFVDCKSKSSFERELYIVEGDSALGACKLARDSSIQALMPVRGKILNCLKAELPKILSSDIIVDLMRVLGCGLEAQSKYIDKLPEFDMEKLNYDKIIICTDADLDGMQIRCLIIAMFYKLCPSLLKQGKIYIAETPIFEIEAKKEIHFAYTEQEKEEVIAKLLEDGVKENQIKLQRSKGLGENEPDMMNKTTMNPLTRRLVPVEYPKDDKDVASYFNALLGDDIETRRILIDEYFELTDVSID